MTTISPVQTPVTQAPAFKGKLKNKIMSLLTVNPSIFIEKSAETLKPAAPQTFSKVIENQAYQASQMPLELLTEKQKKLIKAVCALKNYEKISK